MKLNKKKLIGISILTAFILHTNLNAKEENTQTLDSLEVVSSNVTEGTDSYTIDSMNTSTKLDLSIRDTPQSVSVLTNEALTDFGIDSYQELLTNIAGVTINRYDERIEPNARGFDIDYYKIDGVSIPTYYSSEDIDMVLYDRVEIVRGANGLTTGIGNPAMGINLVRKRANSKKFTGSINIERGSWNERSVTTDISSGLNESGSIRGRIVAKHLKSDSYMDGYEKERNTIYGVIDADITDNTYLSTGASYQKTIRKGVRWGGLPSVYNGVKTDFSRSFIFSEDWTKRNSTKKSFFSDFKHYFKNNISLNASYSYDNITSDNALLYYDPTYVAAYVWLNKPKEIMSNIDVNLKVPFEVNNLNHQIIVGTSYNKYKFLNYDTKYGGASTNLFNHNVGPLASPYSLDTDKRDTQKSLYLASKFSLAENLKFIAGLRFLKFKEDYLKKNTSSNKFNETLPYLGLVFDLNENHSIYASYTSIFKPQDYIDINGNYLDPIDGKSYETGIKGEYFDGKLNATLSVFKIKQANVGEDTGVKNSAGTNIYRQIDGAVSKGYELDINGALTDKINLKFGLAHFNAKKKNGDVFNSRAAKTTANLYTTYKLDKLTLGAGLQYKGKIYVDNTSLGDISQKAVTIANAMAKYKISKNLTAQFNVDNIFDKKYYEGLATDGTVVYADPRNMRLSLTYKF